MSLLSPDNAKTKAIAFFVLIFFLCNSTLTYAQSVYELPKNQIGEVKLAQIADSIQVPAELGSVHRADFKGQVLAVHIQDAHSQLDAQRNIEKILELLTESYHFKTIFVEGGFRGEINPDLLRFFKGEEQNQKFGKQLLEKNFATAPGLFLLKHPRANVYGVEDQKLYQENIAQFRNVYESKPESDRILNRLDSDLQTRASASLNLELRKFLKDWAFFQDSKRDLLAHLNVLDDAAKKHLHLNLHDARNQLQYPQLIRFAKLKDLEKQLDHKEELIEQERKKLWLWLDTNHLESFAPRFRSYFEMSQNNNKNVPLRTFLEKFYESAEKRQFSFQEYPHLTHWFARMIVSEELDSARLFDEIERLTDELLNQLAKTESEKSFIESIKDLRLLRKLLALELSREDWVKAKEKIETLKLLLPARNLDRAIKFYELAEQRENEIAKNITDTLKKTKDDRFILVSGGFHEQGLSELFEKSGISVLSVSPRIGELSSGSDYLNVMLARTRASTLAAETLDKIPFERMTPQARHFYGEQLHGMFSQEQRSEQLAPKSELREPQVGITHEEGVHYSVSEEVIRNRARANAVFLFQSLAFVSFAGLISAPLLFVSGLSAKKFLFSSVIFFASGMADAILKRLAATRFPFFKIDDDKPTPWFAFAAQGHYVNRWYNHSNRVQLSIRLSAAPLFYFAGIANSKTALIDYILAFFASMFLAALISTGAEHLANKIKTEIGFGLNVFRISGSIESNFINVSDGLAALGLLGMMITMAINAPVMILVSGVIGVYLVLKIRNRKVNQPGDSHQDDSPKIDQRSELRFDQTDQSTIQRSEQLAPKSELRSKKYQYFDLGATVGYMINLFRNDQDRKELPTQQELSEALGPSQPTFSNYFEEILTALQAEIEKEGFDPGLRQKIKEATDERRRQRENRKSFDLNETIQYIVTLFQTDKDRKELPTRRQLSKALGPTGQTFSRHRQDILTTLQSEIEREEFDPGLKQRIKEAMDERRRQQENQKPKQDFNLEETIQHIIGLFQTDKDRKELPSQQELSKALGPSYSTFSRHLQDILAVLQSEIDKEGFDPRLKQRIKQAILLWKNFPLTTAQYMIQLFQTEKDRKELPTQPELSKAFGPSQWTFSNHFQDILTTLQSEIEREGFDPVLKQRIEKAIQTKTLRRSELRPGTNVSGTLFRTGRSELRSMTPYDDQALAYYRSHQAFLDQAPFFDTVDSFLTWYQANKANLKSGSSEGEVLGAGYTAQVLFHAGKITKEKLQPFQFHAAAFESAQDSKTIQSAPIFDTVDSFLTWYQANKANLKSGSSEGEVLGASYTTLILFHAGKITKEKLQDFQRHASAFEYAQDSKTIQSAPIFDTVDSFLTWYQANKANLKSGSSEGEVLGASYTALVLFRAGKITKEKLQPFQFHASAFDYAQDSKTIQSAPIFDTVDSFLTWYQANKANLKSGSSEGEVLGASYTALVLFHAGKITKEKLQPFQFHAGAFEYAQDSKTIQSAPIFDTVDSFLTWYQANKANLKSGSSEGEVLGAGYTVQVLFHAGKITKEKLQDFQRHASAFEYAQDSKTIQSAPIFDTVDSFLTWYQANKANLKSGSSEGEVLGAGYTALVLSHAGKITKEKLQDFQRHAGAFERALREQTVIENEIRRIWSKTSGKTYRSPSSRLKAEFDPIKLPNLKLKSETKPLSSKYRALILKYAYQQYGIKLIQSLSRSELRSNSIDLSTAQRFAPIAQRSELRAKISGLLEKNRDHLKGLNITNAAKLIGVSHMGLSLHLKGHPKDFETYGIVKPSDIPTLLAQQGKSKLNGLSIAEAAKLIGVSQKGLSQHLQNHPEDFETYGILAPEKMIDIPALLAQHGKSKLNSLNISQAAKVIGSTVQGLFQHLQSHPEDYTTYGLKKVGRGRPRKTDSRSELRAYGAPNSSKDEHELVEHLIYHWWRSLVENDTDEINGAVRELERLGYRGAWEYISRKEGSSFQRSKAIVERLLTDANMTLKPLFRPIEFFPMTYAVENALQHGTRAKGSKAVAVALQSANDLYFAVFDSGPGIDIQKVREYKERGGLFASRHGVGFGSSVVPSPPYQSVEILAASRSQVYIHKRDSFGIREPTRAAPLHGVLWMAHVPVQKLASDFKTINQNAPTLLALHLDEFVNPDNEAYGVNQFTVDPSLNDPPIWARWFAKISFGKRSELRVRNLMKWVASLGRQLMAHVSRLLAQREFENNVLPEISEALGHEFKNPNLIFGMFTNPPARVRNQALAMLGSHVLKWPFHDYAMLQTFTKPGEFQNFRKVALFNTTHDGSKKFALSLSPQSLLPALETLRRISHYQLHSQEKLILMFLGALLMDDDLEAIDRFLIPFFEETKARFDSGDHPVDLGDPEPDTSKSVVKSEIYHSNIKKLTRVLARYLPGYDESYLETVFLGVPVGSYSNAGEVVTPWLVSDSRYAVWGDAVLEMVVLRQFLARHPKFDNKKQIHDFLELYSNNKTLADAARHLMQEAGITFGDHPNIHRLANFFEVLVAIVYEANGKGRRGLDRARDFVQDAFNASSTGFSRSELRGAPAASAGKAVTVLKWLSWSGLALGVGAFAVSHFRDLPSLLNQSKALIFEIWAMIGLTYAASHFAGRFAKQVTFLIGGVALIFTAFRFARGDLDWIIHNTGNVLTGIAIYLPLEYLGVLFSKVFFPMANERSFQSKLIGALRWSLPHSVVILPIFYFYYIPFMQQNISSGLMRSLFDVAVFGPWTIVLLDVFLGATIGEGQNLIKRGIRDTLQNAIRFFPINFIYWFPATWFLWTRSEDLASIKFKLILGAINFLWLAILQKSVEKIFNPSKSGTFSEELKRHPASRFAESVFKQNHLEEKKKRAYRNLFYWMLALEPVSQTLRWTLALGGISLAAMISPWLAALSLSWVLPIGGMLRSPWLLYYRIRHQIPLGRAFLISLIPFAGFVLAVPAQLLRDRSVQELISVKKIAAKIDDALDSEYSSLDQASRDRLRILSFDMAWLVIKFQQNQFGARGKKLKIRSASLDEEKILTKLKSRTPILFLDSMERYVRVGKLMRSLWSKQYDLTQVFAFKSERFLKIYDQNKGVIPDEQIKNIIVPVFKNGASRSELRAHRLLTPEKLIAKREAARLSQREVDRAQGRNLDWSYRVENKLRTATDAKMKAAFRSIDRLSGAKIKARREAARISMKVVAKVAGRSYNQYPYVELGKRPLSPAKTKAVHAYLDQAQVLIFKERKLATHATVKDIVKEMGNTVSVARIQAIERGAAIPEAQTMKDLHLALDRIAARYLRERRELAEVSHQELAKATRLKSGSFISMVESGRRIPTTKQLNLFHSAINRLLGKKLYDLRRAARVTQKEIEAHSGVGDSQIDKIEKAQQVAPAEKVLKIRSSLQALLGVRLRERREAGEVSLQKLAEQTDRSPAYLIALEQGKIKIAPRDLNEIHSEITALTASRIISKRQTGRLTLAEVAKNAQLSHHLISLIEKAKIEARPKRIRRILAAIRSLTGKAIERKRFKLGLTLKALANLADIDRGTLAKLEEGRGEVDPDIIYTIFAALDMEKDNRYAASFPRSRPKERKDNRFDVAVKTVGDNSFDEEGGPDEEVNSPPRELQRAEILRHLSSVITEAGQQVIRLTLDGHDIDAVADLLNIQPSDAIAILRDAIGQIRESIQNGHGADSRSELHSSETPPSTIQDSVAIRRRSELRTDPDVIKKELHYFMMAQERDHLNTLFNSEFALAEVTSKSGEGEFSIEDIAKDVTDRMVRLIPDFSRQDFDEYIGRLQGYRKKRYDQLGANSYLKFVLSRIKSFLPDVPSRKSSAAEIILSKKFDIHLRPSLVLQMLLNLVPSTQANVIVASHDLAIFNSNRTTPALFVGGGVSLYIYIEETKPGKMTQDELTAALKIIKEFLEDDRVGEEVEEQTNRGVEEFPKSSYRYQQYYLPLQKLFENRSGGKSELRAKPTILTELSKQEGLIPVAIKYMDVFTRLALDQRVHVEDETGLGRIDLRVPDGKTVYFTPPMGVEKLILGIDPEIRGVKVTGNVWETEHPVILEWDQNGNITALFLAADLKTEQYLKLEVLQKKPNRTLEAFNLKPILFESAIIFPGDREEPIKDLPASDIVLRASLVGFPVRSELRVESDFAIRSQRTELLLPYWESKDLYELQSNNRKNWGINFEIIGSRGIWVPLVDRSTDPNQILVAHLIVKGFQREIQPDYFVLRPNPEQISTLVDEHAAKLGLQHAKLLYFPGEGKDPVAVPIPEISGTERRLNAEELIGLLHSSIGGARLLWYWSDQLKKRPWYVWLMEPNKQDPEHRSTFAELYFASQPATIHSFQFNRNRTKDYLPDVLATDARGYGALVGEFGPHSVVSHAKKITTAIRGLSEFRLTFGSGAPRLRRIIFYADEILPGELKFEHLYLSEAQKVQMRFQVASHLQVRKAAFSERIQKERESSSVRKFLENVQGVVNRVQMGLEDSGQGDLLPVQIFYIVDGAFSLAQDRIKVPALVEFKRSGNEYHIVRVRILEEFSDLSSLIANANLVHQRSELRDAAPGNEEEIISLSHPHSLIRHEISVKIGNIDDYPLDRLLGYLSIPTIPDSMWAESLGTSAQYEPGLAYRNGRYAALFSLNIMLERDFEQYGDAVRKILREQKKAWNDGGQAEADRIYELNKDNPLGVNSRLDLYQAVQLFLRWQNHASAHVEALRERMTQVPGRAVTPVTDELIDTLSMLSKSAYVYRTARLLDAMANPENDHLTIDELYRNLEITSIKDERANFILEPKKKQKSDLREAPADKSEKWSAQELRTWLKEELGDELGIDWVKDLVERYENLKPEDEVERATLKELVKQFHREHFMAIQFATVLESQFNGSHQDCLLAIFPELKLAKNEFPNLRGRRGITIRKEDPVQSAKEIRRRLSESIGAPWIQALVREYETMVSSTQEINAEARMRLQALAYVIKEEHLLIASLRMVMNEKFEGNYKKVVQFAFPLLHLNEDRFDLTRKVDRPDYYRRVYRLKKDSQPQLVEVNRSRLNWKFLESPGPYLVRTFTMAHGKVFVFPGRQVGPFLTIPGSKKNVQADPRTIHAPVDIYYDESNIPYEIRLYTSNERTELLMPPVRLHRILKRNRFGIQGVEDVYVSNYLEADRKQLASHQVTGVLNESSELIFGAGHGTESRMSFYENGEPDPTLRNSPFSAYYYAGLPLWILFSGQNRIRVFNRVLSEDSKIVSVFNQMLSAKMQASIFNQQESVLVEGDIAADDSGRIRIAGRQLKSAQLKNTPLAIRIDKGGDKILAAPVIIQNEQTRKWNSKLFENQVMQVANPFISPAPNDREMILPESMDEDEKEMYRKWYALPRISQEGVVKLYSTFIELGDIAFQDLFAFLGDSVLDQKIPSGIEDKKITVREALLRAIRRGDTVIDEMSVGQEAMKLIGKPIKLLDPGRIGFMPLILRAQAASDLIWRLHVYKVSERIAWLMKDLRRPPAAHMDPNLWKDLHEEGASTVLSRAVRSYDTLRKSEGSEKTASFQYYINTAIERAVKTEMAAQKKAAQRTRSISEPVAFSSEGDWFTLESALEGEPRQDSERSVLNNPIKLAAAYNQIETLLKKYPFFNDERREILWLRLLHYAGIQKSTLEQIGFKFHVTGSRIEQRENEIMSYLKNENQALLISILNILGISEPEGFGSRSELRRPKQPVSTGALETLVSGRHTDLVTLDSRVTVAIAAERTIQVGLPVPLADQIYNQLFVSDQTSPLLTGTAATLHDSISASARPITSVVAVPNALSETQLEHFIKSVIMALDQNEPTHELVLSVNENLQTFQKSFDRMLSRVQNEIDLPIESLKSIRSRIQIASAGSVNFDLLRAREVVFVGYKSQLANAHYLATDQLVDGSQLSPDEVKDALGSFVIGSFDLLLRPHQDQDYFVQSAGGVWHAKSKLTLGLIQSLIDTMIQNRIMAQAA